MSDADHIDVSELIRNARMGAGLSQPRAADAALISVQMLRRWEEGDGIATAEKIIAALESWGYTLTIRRDGK